MNIEGKVAAITGGASGLGRATAEAIIARGGQVAILDLNHELAEQTAKELGNARAYQVNVTDDASVSNAIAQPVTADKDCVSTDKLSSAMTTRSHRDDFNKKS